MDQSPIPTVRNSFLSVLESLEDKLYTNRVQDLWHLIALNRFCRKLYIFLYKTVYGDTLHAKVGGFEADFLYENMEEIFMVQVDMPLEKSILLDIESEVETDDNFYDIGANIGIFSALIGSFLSEGNVYCFEPVNQNYNRLRENLEFNEVENSCFKVALSNFNGESTINLASDHTGTRMSSLVNDRFSRKAEVDCRRLDDLIESESLESPDIVKIDVEGAEIEVLEGFERMEDCRLMYVEVHEDLIEDSGEDFGKLEMMLDDKFAETERLKSKGGRSYIKASGSV